MSHGALKITKHFQWVQTGVGSSMQHGCNMTWFVNRTGAFDLIELNVDDLRRDPLAVRKTTLERLLARAAPGLRYNEHLDQEDGPLVFLHACNLGFEGIVSKRRHSPYSSGRSLHWIKIKNPQAPAVKREAEEDWGRWPKRSRRSSR
jgi:ATP-dependent DNA ligase